MIQHFVETRAEVTDESHTDQATLVTIALPAPDVALARTFEVVPTVRIEIERNIAAPNNHAVAVVQAEGYDDDTIITTLQADGDVTAATLLAELDTGWLFQVEWADQVHQRFRHLVAEEATIQAMIGYDDWWTIQILVPDREVLARVYETYEDAGFTIAIERIAALDRERGQLGTIEPAHSSLST